MGLLACPLVDKLLGLVGLVAKVVDYEICIVVVLDVCHDFGQDVQVIVGPYTVGERQLDILVVLLQARQQFLAVLVGLSQGVVVESEGVEHLCLGLDACRVGHHAQQILHADGRHHHIAFGCRRLGGEHSQQVVGKPIAARREIGLRNLIKFYSDRLYFASLFIITTSHKRGCCHCYEQHKR